jgi:hypothetical protein
VELEDALLALEQEHAELEHEIAHLLEGGPACNRAHDMQWRIIEDDDRLSHFTQASKT